MFGPVLFASTAVRDVHHDSLASVTPTRNVGWPRRRGSCVPPIGLGKAKGIRRFLISWLSFKTLAQALNYINNEVLLIAITLGECQRAANARGTSKGTGIPAVQVPIEW